MERAAGLEPTSPARLAGVLPVELCTQNAPCGAVWQRFLSSVRLSGGSPSAVLSLRRSLAPLQGFVFVYQAQFFFGVRPSPALPGRSESLATAGKRWLFLVCRPRGLAASALGSAVVAVVPLGRPGAGLHSATRPPFSVGASCHLAPFLCRFVPKRNATPDFFCLSSEKTTRLPRPVQGEASGSTFWPGACQLLPFCLNSPGPAAASLL